MIATTGRLTAVLGMMLASSAATNVAQAAVTPCAGCFAVVDATGRLLRGKGVVRVTKAAGSGTYDIQFNKPTVKCAWTATIGVGTVGGASPPGQLTVAGLSGTNNVIFLQTYNSAGLVTDLPFHLLISC